MGGSKSSKKTSTVTSNTTTNVIGGGVSVAGGDGFTIGDIGLTGNHAIQIAGVLGQTSIEIAKVHASEFGALLQTSQGFRSGAGAASVIPVANGDSKPINPVLIFGGVAVLATVVVLMKG